MKIEEIEKQRLDLVRQKGLPKSCFYCKGLGFNCNTCDKFNHNFKHLEYINCPHCEHRQLILLGKFRCKKCHRWIENFGEE